ncbi:MAG TPA: S9 family peptidase [Bacteroidales bacterium]|nr:S9 family peptidase [Bacteroidales bacterium]
MKILTAAVLLLLSSIVLPGQQLTIEEAVLQTGFYPVLPRYAWSSKPNHYITIRDNALVETNIRNNKESVLFTKETFNELLAKNGISPVVRLGLPEVLASGMLRFTASQGILDVDPVKGQIAGLVPVHDSMMTPLLGPGGSFVAFTDAKNVYLSDRSGRVRAVTDEKEPGITNGQSVSRQEFGITDGLFWSPQGNYLSYFRKNERAVSEYPLVNIAETPAKVGPVRYPMAGGPSETVELGVYRVSDGATVVIRENGMGENCYLTNISWDPEEKYVFIAVLNREQNHMVLNQYDVYSGQKIRTLFEERSEKYVEPLRGMFFNPANPEQFIWFSERDGYDHLYLYRTDGSLIRQVTRGYWVVTDFLGWDKKGKSIWFRSTEVSPLERHAYRLDMTSGTKSQLTRDPGTHDVIISPDGRYCFDSYSSYTVPGKVVAREASGAEMKVLFEASNPLAGKKLGTYQSLVIKAADKRTDLYGYLILPPQMDPAKKYPVIVYVYGGPHAQLVVNRWLGGASGWQHYMAQLGYISLTLDNRGSDARGRDFEQVIHRNLGRSEMADQMEGIQYLLNQPFVDANRIGVHGWSYGGFMTTSLLLNYPDIFKVGVAGGPVTDWRFYEVMYGERYMDMPSENPDGYQQVSTLGQIRNLRGRLLLIHGDMDQTVVMQNSLAFLKKSVEEGKLVDFLVYPGHPHNVRGKDRVHLMRTVTRYFEDHL